jgi:hypothetical protein
MKLESGHSTCFTPEALADRAVLVLGKGVSDVTSATPLYVGWLKGTFLKIFCCAVVYMKA